MSFSSTTGAAMRRFSRLARLLAVLLCLGLPAVLTIRPAFAANQVVDIATDEDDGVCAVGDCSLREAIAAAGPGDTVTFSGLITSVAVTLGEIPINKNITIDGGAGSPVGVSNTGGRVFNVSDGVVVLNKLYITGGSTGGGVVNSAVAPTGALTITNSRFENNRGTLGGAVNNSGLLTISDSYFTVNSASTSGGSIYNTGTLVLNRSSIEFSVSSAGGAIDSSGDLAATDCLVNSSSTAVGAGGGVRVTAGTNSFTNCTFSANSTVQAGIGGGALAVEGGTANLTNVTVVGNIVPDDATGAGIQRSGGTVNLKNSLVANNRLLGGTANDVAGTITSQDYNLIRTVGSGATINGVTTHNITGVNPLLAPLNTYGASNNLKTHALLPGSPAIDVIPTSAACPATDQRGAPRVATSGGTSANTPCDIGAFESRGFTLTVQDGDAQSTLVNTNFATPLTVAITSASNEPTGSGVLTFTAPASGASLAQVTYPITANTEGVAELTAQANGTAGGPYTVTANAKGVSTPASFSLTNTAAPTPGYGSTPAPGGTLNVGSTTIGVAKTANIAIEETGTADLTINSTSISGTNASEFSVTTATPFTIANGNPAQNLTVSCTPAAVGARSALLTVTYDTNKQATYLLACSGTAVPTPAYSSNPVPTSTVNAGTATVGSQTSTTISVSNNGDATLNVTGVSLSGANASEFIVTPGTLSIANSGAPQTLTVTCTPTAAAQRTATLSVAHNAPNSPATYSLICSGTLSSVPGYSSNPAVGSVISLGNARIGASVTRNLVVSETGTATLEVSSIEISGANAGDFSVSPSSFLITNGGAARSVTITCTPSSVGTRVASLSVIHNASGSPVLYTLTCGSYGTFLPLIGGK